MKIGMIGLVAPALLAASLASHGLFAAQAASVQWDSAQQGTHQAATGILANQFKALTRHIATKPPPRPAPRKTAVVDLDAELESATDPDSHKKFHYIVTHYRNVAGEDPDLLYRLQKALADASVWRIYPQGKIQPLDVIKRILLSRRGNLAYLILKKGSFRDVKKVEVGFIFEDVEYKHGRDGKVQAIDVHPIP